MAMNALRVFLAVLVISAAAQLQAGTISYHAGTNGINAPTGATFSASGGALTLSVFTEPLITFLGVGSEVDLGQSITISFLSPQIFNSLTLGMLFDGPEYGDGNERAGAYPNGSPVPFILTATGETTATWSLLTSTVTNLSPATDYVGAGIWSIQNPFGDLQITSLTLTPLSSGSTGSESDFGLVAFQTRGVPDLGSTLGLFLLSLAGLATLRRKI